MQAAREWWGSVSSWWSGSQIRESTAINQEASRPSSKKSSMSFSTTALLEMFTTSNSTADLTSPPSSNEPLADLLSQLIIGILRDYAWGMVAREGTNFFKEKISSESIGETVTQMLMTLP